MELSDSLSTLIAAALIVGFLLISWRVLMRRTHKLLETPESLEQVADARIDPEERASAIISEQIEEMVRQKLVGFQDLAETKIDFATAADGSLEIWVAGERFADATHIPDQRIRDAIIESVEIFNR
jgi:hypothetical protein